MPPPSSHNYLQNVSFFKSDSLTLTKLSLIWYTCKNYTDSSEIPQRTVLPLLWDLIHPAQFCYDQLIYDLPDNTYSSSQSYS